MQLVSGVYTVVGMPADTLAQVVNASFSKHFSEKLEEKREEKKENEELNTILPSSPSKIIQNDAKIIQIRQKQTRKILSVAAAAAAVSTAAQLAVSAFCKFRNSKFNLI